MFLLYAGSSSSLVNPEGVLNFIEISLNLSSLSLASIRIDLLSTNLMSCSEFNFSSSFIIGLWNSKVSFSVIPSFTTTCFSKEESSLFNSRISEINSSGSEIKFSSSSKLTTFLSVSTIVWTSTSSDLKCSKSNDSSSSRDSVCWILSFIISKSLEVLLAISSESSSLIVTGAFTFFVSNPVAITVILTAPSNEASLPIPSIIFTSLPAAFCIWFLIISNSEILISSSPSPETIFNNTCWAPVISLSFKSGESNASVTASIALFSPLAIAWPISAVPLFSNTFLASFRSILTTMCWEITSAIPFVAVFKTSFALPNAWVNVKSP